MSQANVETVRSVYEGWRRGDFAAGVRLLERNVVLIIDLDIPDGGVYVGVEGIREYMGSFLDAWDSLTIAGEAFEAAGDSVLVRVRQSGVGRESGIPVDQEYFQAWTFRGGEVIRIETILDERRARDAVGLRE